MGDHLAYYRTSPDVEELAFVRIARAISPRCESVQWYDNQSRLISNQKKKGAKSKRRLYDSSPVTLKDMLKTEIDSLSDHELAQLLATLTASGPTQIYFDAHVACGQEVMGYLTLRLDSEPFGLPDRNDTFRLEMTYRLMRDEKDENDLASQADAIDFICGLPSIQPFIEQIEECFVVGEGRLAQFPNIFSRYDIRSRDILKQLEAFCTLAAQSQSTDFVLLHAESDNPFYDSDDATRLKRIRLANERIRRSWNKAHSLVASTSHSKKMSLLASLKDSDLLNWYLQQASESPNYRAWKAGDGVMTTTTSPRGMTDLYVALLEILE